MISFRCRIAFTTVALTAALVVAAPSPSHAAGRTWELPVTGAWVKAWSWLIDLRPVNTPPKPGTVREKEGGAMNPNGSTAQLVVPSGCPILFSPTKGTP